MEDSNLMKQQQKAFKKFTCQVYKLRGLVYSYSGLAGTVEGSKLEEIQT